MNATCWNCHERVAAAVCAGCGAIQPPPREADAFAVLGLPRRYALEVAAVEERWRALSRQVHPDRFAAKGAVEKRMALLWTAAVNEARRVLRDKRARAWLLASGRPTPPETGGPVLDADFLEEIFDLQAGIPDDPPAALAAATAWRDRLDAALDAAFAAWEAGAGGLDGVADTLSRLKYLDNAIAQANAAAPLE